MSSLRGEVPVRDAMTVRYERAGPERAANLLLMLPGARDAAEDFFEQGLVAALGENECVCDVVALDAHMEYYLEQSLVQHVHTDVIVPALAQGYRSIWLLGISLGGMGCLQYARAYPQHLAGVILLAPFLATRGLIAEVSAAGGLQQWVQGDISNDSEREFLAWLKTQALEELPYSHIYLGYGSEDRFAPASALLAQRLPAAHTLVLGGGHDWATWKQLWMAWLTRWNPWRNAD